MKLNGKTIFISGASRGIGLAIAAKTAAPNPKLPGTIYTAAADIEAAGGRALALQVDIREEQQVADAARATADKFGGIDILINNASAINLTSTEGTPMKRFDLMLGVNLRGTYLCTQACLPYLKVSAQRQRNPHVLTLSPPLNMEARWFAPHVAYTIAKYGMSLCVLGHAEEFRPLGIAVNALWPRTVIQTAALQMIPGIKPENCRSVEIMADAAYAILTTDATTTTGNFFIDEEVLKKAGVTDFGKYSVVPGSKQLLPDLFL